VVPALQEIVDEFALAPRELRMAMLLDHSRSLPPLPERYRGDPGLLERVHECQTPFFVAVEVGDDGRVALHFDAPEEAPTTRGYAGILAAGLDGATVEEVLATPPDFFTAMGLGELISPLRLRGMGAILAHVKRQVVARAAAADPPAGGGP
jgi:cysteine desulfuration protein SufE